MAAKLTPKQLHFATLAGTPDERGRFRTATECYRLAYNSGGAAQTAIVEASKLIANPRIAEQIKVVRDAALAEIEEAAKGGIAIKANRIKAKQRRHDLITDLLEARQRGLPEVRRQIEDLENDLANEEDENRQSSLRFRIAGLYGQLGIGEETGLLARDVKKVGEESVDIFRFDKAVMDSLLDLEDSVAKERGELILKTDVTSNEQTISPVVFYIPDNGRGSSDQTSAGAADSVPE